MMRIRLPLLLSIGLLACCLLGCPDEEIFDEEPEEGTDDDTAGDDDTDPVTSCLTMASDDGAIIVVEMDLVAKTFTEILRLDEAIAASSSQVGFARFGDTLVAPLQADYVHTWMEVDLVAGTSRTGGDTIDSTITTDGTHLVAFCNQREDVCRYASFDDLVARTAIGHIPFEAHGSRLAANEDRIFTAWHATDEVTVLDGADGAILDTLLLEDWDDWVQGMVVVGDSLYLLNSVVDPVLIGRFDLSTGARLETFEFEIPEFSERVQGLWCG